MDTYTYYRGKIEPTEIEGAGPAFELKLWTVSEDGRQPAFVGGFIERGEAEAVLKLWTEGQHRIVYCCASLIMES